MKLLDPKKSCRALTLIDVLILMAVMALIAVCFLLTLTRSGPRHGPRIFCVNNLKQIGLAFRNWSNEHSEQFPWNSPGTNAGTRDFAMSSQVWRHFEITSNEVSSPKIFFCPADRGRTKALSWQPRISNRNISYFIGLDAAETKPQSVLSGDRNLSTNDIILAGVVSLQNPTTVRWTAAIHENAGNIAFGDGSVQQVSGRTLFQCITNAGLPLRLSIP